MQKKKVVFILLCRSHVFGIPLQLCVLSSITESMIIGIHLKMDDCVHNSIDKTPSI